MQEITNNDFYYPENLTEKTTFAGWEWWALALIAAGVLISIVCLFYMQLILPLLFTIIFTVCTFKFGGMAVYNLIIIMANYWFADQMTYYWSAERSVSPHGNSKK